MIGSGGITSAPRARVVAVVGPSGVGKDSVIRALVGADSTMRWVRRVITRPVDPSEPFRAATEAEFDRMEAEGAFALSWGAHGMRYGVPRAEIDALVADDTGLVNLSRGVLARAAEVLPSLSVLSVSAPADVLATRLSGRGREDAEAIAARLARPAPPLLEGLPVLALDNGGPLERTVAEARAWLAQAAPA